MVLFRLTSVTLFPANLNIPKMGINMPNMGMKAKIIPIPPRTSLADALFSDPAAGAGLLVRSAGAQFLRH